MKNSECFKNKWRFFHSLARYIWKENKTWIGKELRYNKKKHRVIKETYDTVILEGVAKPVNKRHWRKENEQYTRK